MIKPKKCSTWFARVYTTKRQSWSTEKQTHRVYVTQRRQTNTTDLSQIIEPQPWSHCHSPIIIIIIYWPDWSRRCSGGRRTSVSKVCARGDGGDLVVLHVEQVGGCAHHGEGDKGERETTYWRFNDNMASVLERNWKKRNWKRVSTVDGRRRQPSCSPGRGRPTS